MIKTKFKTKKVVVNGKTKFVPIVKKTIFGFGSWKECKEWTGIEKKFEAERVLDLDSESTLTHIRSFIDERTRDPLKNEYYND